MEQHWRGDYQMQRISVKERLPGELQAVLVHGEHENEYFRGFGVTWLSYGRWVGSVHPVTHWMELPQAPCSE
jgi:hypothetical protein